MPELAVRLCRVDTAAAIRRQSMFTGITRLRMCRIDASLRARGAMIKMKSRRDGADYILIGETVSQNVSSRWSPRRKEAAITTGVRSGQPKPTIVRPFPSDLTPKAFLLYHRVSHIANSIARVVRGRLGGWTLADSVILPRLKG